MESLIDMTFTGKFVMLNEISQTQNIDSAVSCHICQLILELRNFDYIVFKIHIYVYIYLYMT